MVAVAEKPAETQAKTAVVLEDLTAETVTRLVFADPQLWTEIVLPALIDGVFDGAERLVWFGGPDGEGDAHAARGLVYQFNLKGRIRRWEGR